jgi:hypothetical protein
MGVQAARWFGGEVVVQRGGGGFRGEVVVSEARWWFQRRGGGSEARWWFRGGESVGRIQTGECHNVMRPQPTEEKP